MVDKQMSVIAFPNQEMDLAPLASDWERGRG